MGCHRRHNVLWDKIDTEQMVATVRELSNQVAATEFRGLVASVLALIIKQLKMVSMVHSKQSTCSEASQTSVVFLLIDARFMTVIEGFQSCFLLLLLLWSRWNHQSQVVRAQKDQQKRSAEKNAHRKCCGEVGPTLPLCNYYFNCFYQKMQTKEYIRILKVGCEDCYSHDLAPM